MKKILLIFMLFTMFTRFDIKANEPKYEDVHDALITALYPYIKEEIHEYYKEFKQFDLFNIELTINKISGFSFNVIVCVKTFEHAHNPPYSKDKITFKVSPFGVETIDYNHEPDDYEVLINEFTDEIIDDIKTTFNLHLDDYTKYNHSQLYYQSFKFDTYNGLFKLSSEIVTDILSNELNLPEQPYKNFIDPVTFINEDEALIMFKRSNGLNTIYKVKYTAGEWIVYDQISKMGKKMDELLLWYM